MNLPGLPDPHAIAVLLLTALALFLFTRDRIPLESSSFFVLVVLSVGFTLFPYRSDDGGLIGASDFFAGFGHEALVAVSALMIVGHSLVRTGALEPVGRTLARIWKVQPVLSFLLALVIGAVLSAFVNNTPIVVLMLPILINVSLRTGQSPSNTLLPVGLATIIGGMTTTIGTSTNLLVVSVAADMGVAPFGMFDFLLPVVIAGGVAVLYLWLIAPRMLPHRDPPMEDTNPRLFTAQIKVQEGSPAVAQRLHKVIALTDDAMQVQRIQRGDLFLTTLPDVQVKPDDMLVVTDTGERLREFARVIGGQLYSGEHEVDAEHPLLAKDQRVAEMAVMAGSRLDGMRVEEARLASQYNLTLVAIHRGGEVSKARTPGLQAQVLRAGDVLLVQGSGAAIEAAKDSGALLLLDGSAELPATRHAPLALATMTGVVTVAALGFLPIAVSALLGCLVLLMTGCLKWRDITRALSVQVILIVVASLALGAALMKTGGADYMAQLFVAATFGMAPGFVLAGLMLCMALLTNIVSNNAAAVIGTPIAISIAQRLGMPVEPFVLAVLFGANMSFATPMAYQTNLLVMNAGGYRFGDFVRVGVPLIIVLWLLLSLLLTWSYRLQ